MARILCIDYGEKRCGLAVTDPLQIIVSALATVDSASLPEYIFDYCKKEEVEKIVIGLPAHRDGSDTHLVPAIRKLEEQLRKGLPGVKTDFQNEYGTSASARQIIFQSGVPREKRKDKARLDRVSAVLILQRYLGHI